VPRLIWDKVGDRRFETGVDRGVLYTTDGVGVAWNGLTSVRESTPGGEARAFYLDGLKYLNIAGGQDFAGTIEAYTYPDEFSIHDGTVILDSGLIATQQRRRPFAFSYRTRIGNDVDGPDKGYKIHIVYNALAAPSEASYSSIGSSSEPSTFSWEFTTTPKRPKSETPLAPLAHIVIDSTKTNPSVLRYIEEQLYGSTRQQPHLVLMDDLFRFFENPQFVLSIFADRVNGLSPLVLETDGTGDLIGDNEIGLYQALSESRLVKSGIAGLYRLTPLNPSFTEVADDPGIFNIQNASMAEDLTDSGTYTYNKSLVVEDSTDPGTFLTGS